jgi:predicted peptidase
MPRGHARIRRLKTKSNNRYRLKYLADLQIAALVLCCGAAWSAESDDAAGVRHGDFDVTLTYAELSVLTGTEDALYPLGDDETVTWRVHVPRSYHPDTPAGLVVYISPTASGQLRSDWQPVLEEYNLIWVSAHESGNRTPTKRRILYATLAPYVAADMYEIDPERVYLSGFSGGGKAAGIASISLARLFKGAIFICGAELWPDTRRQHYAAAASNRYVFVSGSRDFNRELTTATYRKYVRAGLTNSRLMIIPGMDHRTPSAKHFREAIHFLHGDD